MPRQRLTPTQEAALRALAYRPAVLGPGMAAVREYPLPEPSGAFASVVLRWRTVLSLIRRGLVHPGYETGDAGQCTATAEGLEWVRAARATTDPATLALARLGQKSARRFGWTNA